MVRSKALISAIVFVSVVLFQMGAVNASQATDLNQQSKPIDRGFGQHDACFGDKYESDEDLKTGNEISIEEILKRLNTPGT